MTIAEQIAQKAQQLSPQHQQQALDFIEFLLSKSAYPHSEKQQESSTGKLLCTWRGALADLKSQYRTSVELQKKAMDWRVGEE